MEEKIKSITEAFSMQPRIFSTLTQDEYKSYYDKANACKEIKREVHGILWHGDAVKEVYYVGYNFEGKKIFQFLAISVNITFEWI